MRIFNFDTKERWQRVEDEMYLVWLGNQRGAVLPRFLDSDFKKCMKRIKSLYSLRACEKQLKLC